MPHAPKYKISDTRVLYGTLAEKDFGGICKAFLSRSRRNEGMGRFLCRIIFQAGLPESNSFLSRSIWLALTWHNLHAEIKCLEGVGIMVINNSMGRTGMFSFGNHRTKQRTNTYDSWMNDSRGLGGNESTGVSAAKSAAEKKRMLSRDREDEPGAAAARGIVEQSFSYADSLRNTRAQKKSTAQKLKKLQYSYKSISSQLIRSKTSVDAAKVARKARRELVMLKGKRMYENEKYDSYELEAAITHAQAMVRVARKKVKHLQEEELMKVKGGPCAGELEEKKEEENQLTDEERAYLEQQTSGGGTGNEIGGESAADGAAGSGSGSSFVSQEDVHQARQEWAQAYEEVMSQSEIQEEMRMMELQRARERADSMADAMSELTDEMSDSMQELLEELGLEELAESTSRVEVEMDPEDYKMLKLKHRLEEMKAIAEADAEYLKAVFNKLEKAKDAVSQASSSSGSNNNSAAFGGSSGGMVVAANNGGAALASAPVQAQAIDVVSTPDAVSTVAAASMEGGSVDVSV